MTESGAPAIPPGLGLGCWAFGDMGNGPSDSAASIGLIRDAWEQGITHWSAVMEPALLRLIGRLGIDFSPLGPLVDYHGTRQPCHGDTNEVLAGIKRQQRDVWALITDSGRYCGSD